MTLLNRSPRAALLSAASVLALTAFGQAHAQQSDAQEAPPAPSAAAPTTPASPASADAGQPNDELIVTGFRASLANALTVKRNANTIVESVAPEDFGKFPDQNVAESLQRLPGVQIDRTNGVGTKVRIRGLDQNVVLLDGDSFVTGRELYATGEGAGGGGNLNNDSLEGIPSELIGAINVYKSPDASLVEGGLGGVIDFRTRNALDAHNGLTVGGNFHMSHGQHSDSWTPAGALVATYNWNDRFGITGALSYNKLDTHEDEVQGANRGGWVLAGPTTGVDNTVGKDYIEPELLYFTHRDVERVQRGAFIGLDWKVSDALTTNFTWFHSQLSIDDRDIANKVWFHSNGLGLGLDASKPYDIDSNGVVTNGTFRSNGAETNTLVQETKNKADNLQWQLRYNNGGPLRASAKLSYSRGTLDSQFASADQERSHYGIDPANGVPGNDATPTAPGGANGPYSFTYSNSGDGVPTIGYLAPYDDLLTNPAYGLFKSHWAFADRDKTTAWAGRADVEWDPQFITSTKATITAGVRYSTRKVDYVLGRYLLDQKGAGNCATNGTTLNGLNGTWGYFQDPGLCGATPVQTFTSNPDRLVNLTDFFPSGGAGYSNILAQDPAQMTDPAAWLHSLYPQYDEQFFVDPINSFKVKEKVTSGYIMADFGGADERYHANAGVRIVHTQLGIDQNALTANPRYWGTASWNGVYRDFTTTNFDRSYTDILPSANLTFDFTEDSKLRVAAARVVASQNLFQLGTGFQTNFTRQFVDPHTGAPVPNGGFAFTSGSRGNPELDPYRATQFDVAVEHYFGRQGLISIDGFWKEVDSFVVQQTDSVIVPDDFGGDAGPVTAPHNGSGGRIQGFELNAQYAFDFGLGFAANYTYSKSTSPTKSDFDSHLPIPGVSKNSFTVQGYYEAHGFAARLSYSWRDRSFNSLFGFPSAAPVAGNIPTKTYGVFNKAYGQLDGQLSYQVTHNFGIVLEGINLTNSSVSTYLQYKNQPYTWQDSGRRFNIGGRFTF